MLYEVHSATKKSLLRISDLIRLILDKSRMTSINHNSFELFSYLTVYNLFYNLPKISD